MGIEVYSGRKMSEFN